MNKMPQAWKDKPGSKLLKTEQGLQWKFTEHYNIRVMDGNPSSQFQNQKSPYVRLVKNGTRMDKYGNYIQSNHPDFEELTHIPINEVSDELLEIFFN